MVSAWPDCLRCQMKLKYTFFSDNSIFLTMKDDESSKMICFESQKKFINMFSDISISKLNCITTLNMNKPTEGSKLFCLLHNCRGGGGSRIPSLARLHVLLRLAFHWRGCGPHGRVKEWCAVSAYHSLTQPCGPKPRQWKAGLRLAFHWRGCGPHDRVKEWCAVSADHSLTQPCGPKPRQWKASLSPHFSLCRTRK